MNDDGDRATRSGGGIGDRLPRRGPASRCLRWGAVAVGAGLALGSGPVEASATTTPPAGAVPVVTVTSAGDAATAIDLTPVESTGRPTRDVTTVAVIGEASNTDGWSVHLDAEGTLVQLVEIAAANPDGSSTLTSTVESVDVTVRSGDEDALGVLGLDLFEYLRGVPLEADHNAQSVRTAFRVQADVSPTPEQAAIVAYWDQQGDTGTLALPDSEVGVGATWTITFPVSSDGIESPTRYDYELVDVTGSSVQIDYTLTSDITGGYDDREVGAVTAVGTISGSGAVTADLATRAYRFTAQTHYAVTYDSATRDAIWEYDVWHETVGTPVSA